VPWSLAWWPQAGSKPGLSPVLLNWARPKTKLKYSFFNISTSSSLKTFLQKFANFAIQKQQLSFCEGLQIPNGF
jgi:hypothetical protein